MTADPAEGLDARVVVTRHDFRLDVDLRVPPGAVAAVVGPNGAGKSTLLGALAGLVPLDAGRVALDGRVLEQRGEGPPVRIPTEHRGIGVVFSDHLLFPHLTALGNVAFGPRAQGVSRPDADARAHALLDRLGLAGLADRRPARLSGGQSQRVALARALVLEPKLLLLDEPLAALDAGTRLDVRDLLADELRRFGGAAVIVTHDPVDALALADRIHVVESGRVMQEGPPGEVAAAPGTAYVARLMGMNRIAGRDEAGRRVLLVVAPVDVRLDRAGAAAPGVDQPRSTGVVRRIETGAGRIRVTLRVAAASARAAATGGVTLDPDPDADITAELDAASFAVLRPAVGEELTVRIPSGSARAPA